MYYEIVSLQNSTTHTISKLIFKIAQMIELSFELSRIRISNTESKVTTTTATFI